MARAYGTAVLNSAVSPRVTLRGASGGQIALLELTDRSRSTATNATVNRTTLATATGGVTPTTQALQKLNSRSGAPTQSDPAISWVTAPTLTTILLAGISTRRDNRVGQFLPARPWALPIATDTEQLAEAFGAVSTGGNDVRVITRDPVEHVLIPRWPRRPRVNGLWWVRVAERRTFLALGVNVGLWDTNSLRWSGYVPARESQQRPKVLEESVGETFPITVGGTIDPAGALLKTAAKVAAGQTSPAGELTKRAEKAPSGATMPVGDLTKRVEKPFGGQTSPAGSLLKTVLKAIAGMISPSGELATTVVTPLAVSGEITPTGALGKTALKPLGGQMTPAGAVAKETRKPLAGQVSPTGAALKLLAKAFAGTLAPAGSLLKVPGKVPAGQVSPTGALARTVAKQTAGTVTPTGSLSKGAAKAFGGLVVPVGDLVATLIGTFAGAISFGRALLKWTLGRPELKWLWGRPGLKWTQGPGEE